MMENSCKNFSAKTRKSVAAPVKFSKAENHQEHLQENNWRETHQQQVYANKPQKTMKISKYHFLPELNQTFKETEFHILSHFSFQVLSSWLHPV